MANKDLLATCKGTFNWLGTEIKGVSLTTCQGNPYSDLMQLVFFEWLSKP